MKQYPKPLLVDGSLFIDNSSLEVFTTCDRAAEYLICHKRVLAEPKPALNFGSAIHKAMEIRVQFPELDDQTLLSRQANVLAKHFADNPQPDDDYRTLDFAIEVCAEYARNYPKEFEFQTARKDSEFISELPFALPIGSVEVNDTIDGEFRESVPVIWTGKIDSIIIDTRGEYWVRDFKTTSMGGGRFFDDFLMSPQMKGYVWAAQQILGQPVAGAMIDALIGRKPTKTGKGIEFGRSWPRYSQSAVDTWRLNTLHLIADFFKNGQRDYFPTKEKWCHGKYNRCPYFDVCSIEPAFRNPTLYTSLYKDQDWSPLNQNE